MAALTALLGSCATAPAPGYMEGAGFSKGNPSPEMRAAMINTDVGFYRWYRAHEATCERQSGCDKTK